MMRGQSTSDFVLGFALIIVLAVGLIVPSLKQAEMSLALASARLGASEYVAYNTTLYLTSLTYNVSNNNVTISPTVYAGGSRYYNDHTLLDSMLSRMNQAFSPAVSNINYTTDCVNALFNSYCVVN